MKIEPGLFQVFKKAGKKNWKKPVKIWKSLLENVESTQKVWDLGDLLTDRGRTTPVSARVKGRFNFSPAPSSPSLLAGAEML